MSPTFHGLTKAPAVISRAFLRLAKAVEWCNRMLRTFALCFLSLYAVHANI
jgi:16S rRNA G527 N7-methylase RsmG